ncbi:MAG: hypothetical protein WBP40_03300 [Candidatus Moraniibacteriota bacterium]
MSKKEVREDVYALFFAAKLSVIVVGAFVIAIGLDIYHAAQAIGKTYGG